MIKKRVEKKITLCASFKDVFVCVENSQKPFIEIFVQEPENVAQLKLGTIGGILEITDYSEDSSYIVNYLISVIKKEYFSKTKRGTIESFEAALHKTNLALAKLAEHGNIGWIGKINAIVFVIDKNNLHISKTGTAYAFMQRQRSFTDICEGLEIPNPPNPLKTFTDVLSGRIEKSDRLIFATDGIFEIFSFEEMKRNAIKFSFADFTQFLKTALSNELSKAAVQICEIQEKTEEVITISGSAQKVNAWSQDSYEKSVKMPIENVQEADLVREIRSEIEKKAGDFVDKKTGHIYIKEDAFPEEEPSLKTRISSFADFFIGLMGLVKKSEHGSHVREDIPVDAQIEVRAEAKLRLKDYFLILKKAGRKLFDFLKKSAPFFSFLGRQIANLAKKLFDLFRKTSASSRNIVRLRPGTTIRGVISGKIFPSFGKIGAIFSRLDRRQKAYALIAIIALFVIPYFIAKISQEEEKEPEAVVETADLTPRALPVENEKNTAAIAEKGAQTVAQGSFFQLVDINTKFFAIGKNNIYDLENKADFQAPEVFGEIKTAAGMDDLNLIFIANEQNKIMSWSPISKKFQDNILNLPDNARISAMDCYLTYLYVFDAASGAIYRFPRAEGGFGLQTSWLKDSLDLSWGKDISINENIYVAGKNNIVKLFRNRRQDFSPEASGIELSAEKIYAKQENIYVLDADNARIIRYGVDGKIQNQYYGQEIKSATDISVSEEAGQAYFTNGTGVLKFSL